MVFGQRVSSSSASRSLQDNTTNVPQLSASKRLYLHAMCRDGGCQLCVRPQIANVGPFQSAPTAPAGPFWSAHFSARSPRPTQEIERNSPPRAAKSHERGPPSFDWLKTSKSWKKVLLLSPLKLCDVDLLLRVHNKHTETSLQRDASKMAAKQTVSLTPKLCLHHGLTKKP